MKSYDKVVDQGTGKVAPFAGAWIEITILFYGKKGVIVAPFAGAWIEILSDKIGHALF